MYTNQHETLGCEAGLDLSRAMYSGCIGSRCSLELTDGKASARIIHIDLFGLVWIVYL